MIHLFGIISYELSLFLGSTPELIPTHRPISMHDFYYILLYHSYLYNDLISLQLSYCTQIVIPRIYIRVY